MQSQNSLPQVGFQERIKHFAGSKWDSLTDRQQSYSKKIWKVITYKWRWQIAMNVPYLAVFILDRSIPAVHRFDIALLATVTSKLPIPAFVSSWMGLG